jgi:hypothetical protein
MVVVVVGPLQEKAASMQAAVDDLKEKVDHIRKGNDPVLPPCHQPTLCATFLVSATAVV